MLTKENCLLSSILFVHGTFILLETLSWCTPITNLLRYPESQPHTSFEQARLLEVLPQLDLKTTSISGTSNVFADALSRLPKNVATSKQRNIKRLKQTIPRTCTLQLNQVPAISFKPSKFLGLPQNYKEDEDIRAHYEKPTEAFHTDSSLLYSHGKLRVLWGSFRLDLLQDYHSVPTASHLETSDTERGFNLPFH